MYSPTYLELKTQVQQELDIEDETFITPNEILNYFNEGIDMVEAAIHTIYEDYFLTITALSVVASNSAVSLPDDIYAQKIRQIWYNDNNALNYEVRKIKKLEDVHFSQNTDLYTYLILNDAAIGLRIFLNPQPQQDEPYMSIFYIRNAKRFVLDTDVCDIPEFTSVVVQYARWKCMSKEAHPDTQQALADLVNMKQMMVDTLSARIPDEHNEIIQDVSFYDDFDNTSLGDF